MMLHFTLHWPQEARLDLWPFAVDYAVWLWNHLPDTTTRLSPIEFFTKTTFPDHRHLQRISVFGCPVFVLYPTLQDAKKLLKWQRRSSKGIFLGFSPKHHTNVALVLNPETGSLTPHYHVVFDEKISTITFNVQTDSIPDLKPWRTLLDDEYDQHEVLQSPETHLPPDTDVVPLHAPEPPTPILFIEFSPSSVEPTSDSLADISPDVEVLQDVPGQESVPAIRSDDGSTSPISTSDPITDSDDTRGPKRQTRSGR
jgi:hypothetical protein